MIFNAILPLVGISLQGVGGYNKAYSFASDTINQLTTADTTQAPATTRTLFSRDSLDQDLANLESNFDLFKGNLF